MGLFDFFKKRKKISFNINGKEYHTYIDCSKSAIGKFCENSQSESLTPVPSGCERVNINIFLDKYIASISQDLFIELQNRVLAGYSYADIPISKIEQVRQNYEAAKRIDEALQKCADLNNKGIAFEKVGNIDAAIKCYEENIEQGYTATHSYERLMILHRKQKEYDKEISVIEKAINIFSNENEKRAKHAIEECPSKRKEINDALKSCIAVYGDKISTFIGKPMVCFNPYDINKYRKRLEKAKLLKEKTGK